MNSPETIAIHEFSTGIHPQQTPDGWVSRGFTGQYMNRTLHQIPEVVERAIANREFAVTEGFSGDRPAIIGRVVGSEAEAWSVMAVVTRGRDEKGRSLSVYRYFLCEGSQKLWQILAWWESRRYPSFNPFDPKFIGKPDLYVAPHQNNVNLPQLGTLPLNTPDPILYPPQPDDSQNINSLQWINILAIKKANTTKQSVSWAWNVEALEQPRRFQVILPASDRAYQILQRAIANTPLKLAPAVVDEEAIKSAIRSLMNSSQMKSEAVVAIVQAVMNEKISSDYWHTLFDGQGSKTAIIQKIYSPQMVQLVTLRAMVIPETLPEFLGWLNFKGGNKKLDEKQNLSLNFQSELIRNQFPPDKLTAGMKLILPKLLNKEIAPEAVRWLLAEPKSAWSSCLDRFIEDIEDDLKLISDSRNPSQGQDPSRSDLKTKNFKCGNEIWKLLINQLNFINYARSSSRKYKHDFQKYKSFAELFKLIENYPLSAYFYQVSDGIVSETIFIRAFNSRDYSRSYLGLNIERKVSLNEKLFNFIKNQSSNNLLLMPLILLILSFLYLIVKPGDDTEPEDATEEIDRDFGDGIREHRLFQSKIEIPEDKKKEALSKFDTTVQTINKIAEEIREDRKDIKKEQIIKQMMIILETPDLDYAQAEKSNTEEREKLIQAIYLYQKKNPIEYEHLGYMEPNMQSADLLREKIKTNLGLSSPSSFPPN
jgi:hypothetical protein